MDRLKQLETFVAVAARGSLTAAANAEGVAPAIIGRRIDALEARLGVKLLLRTTRRLSLTDEGSSYLEDCQRLLAELQAAEANVSAGSIRAGGHLRVTAPAGFGRRHVAPLVPEFQRRNPAIALSLDLTDRVVDLLNEGYDCAVRVGALADSSLVSVRLGDSLRVCVAAPAYLRRHGAPQTPQELPRHRCLAYAPLANQARPAWVFQQDGVALQMRVGGPLDCTDGAVLHEWCLQGHGLAWRSMWEVGEDLAAGRLVEVLADYATAPVGINVVFAQRKHMPLRQRLWIDYLKECFADPALWPWG
jgi:DNA-binding transcriptional LysR family regulator